MKQLLRLLCGIIPFFLFACDYSPSGNYFEEVNAVPEVVADITLHEHQDTIFIRGSKYLNFSIDLPDRNFYGFQLKLGNQVVAEGNSLTQVLFRSTQYSDGYHTLKFSAISNSGTGSLADKAGAEALEIYKTWVVFIDNAPPSPVAITSIKPENGQLKVEWEQYKRPGFVMYELYRILEKGSLENVATFRDPKSTSWLDNVYVGGPVRYYISAYTDSHHSGTAGPVTQYNYPLARVLHYSYNEANDLTITFSATPFYQNFKEYVLHAPEGLSYQSMERTDTVVTFRDPGFGNNFNIKLVAYPNNYYPNVYDKLMYTQATIQGYGTSWGPFVIHRILRRPQTNSMYALDNDVLKAIDATTLQVKHQREIQYTSYMLTNHVVSEDGRHVYALISGRLHKLDPATLQTQESYPLNEVLPGDFHNSVNLQGASNTNRLVIATKNSWSYRDSVYVLDMEQKNILKRSSSSVSPGQATISANGKALRVSSNFYLEQSDGSWQQQPVPVQDVTTLAFHPSEPWYYIKQGNAILFYSIATGTLEKKLHTEAELFGYEIDEASGNLFGYNSNMFYVYNIASGQLVRKLKLANNTGAFVYKNRIFSADRYIPL